MASAVEIMINPHVIKIFIVKSGRKLLFEIHIGLNTSLICDYCCQDRETADTRTFGYNLARQLVTPHIHTEEGDKARDPKLCEDKGQMLSG